MWPFSKKPQFPGVKEHADGTIEFSLTDEEAKEVDIAFEAFKGWVVHPDAVERLRNGTTAVALSHYATELYRTHYFGLAELTESEYRAKWPSIRGALEKAVAAVWKSYSLCPLPIFLFHRAVFPDMLGIKSESRQLFGLFVSKQSEFHADDLDKALVSYEGTDTERALAHARGQVSDGSKVPWDELGATMGSRLIPTVDRLSALMMEGLAGLVGPAIPDFESPSWKYELCIFLMFWMWYVANSPKLTKCGATEPLLDAYHRACWEVMVKAGLVDNSEKALRAWEGDLEERFMAYKGAYGNVHARPDYPLRVVGRATIGWLLSRHLFPTQNPDPRFVTAVNDCGGTTFRNLVKMVTELEADYEQRDEKPR